MRQMHASRKEDRLAAEQKDGRAFIFTSRRVWRYTKVGFVRILDAVLSSEIKLARQILLPYSTIDELPQKTAYST